jgi:branched-chain amino acid transport system substrate-binding protein
VLISVTAAVRAWLSEFALNKTNQQRRSSMKIGMTSAILVGILGAPWAASANAQDIALGYLPSAAGPFATFSKTNEISAQIAIDEINAGGGIAGKKLRIVAFDTAGKPDQAVVGLRKLADDDKVLAIIGPFSSSECRVVFPAGDRAGVVAMSMASSAPKLAEPFQYAFRNTSDEGYMFERVMRALKSKNVPIATGAIAYATDDVISKVMGENVLPGIMKKAGTDVKLSVTFQTAAFDFSAQASQLVAQPTDLIGVGSGPEPATRLVQELRRQGHKGRLVAGSTIADPELGRQMGTAGDGTTIPTTFYSELNDRTKAFQAEFAKRARAAGLDRGMAAQFDAATYDIVLLYAHAMKQANVTGEPSKLATERTAIKDELRKMKNFGALEGAISFGANGDALKPVYAIQLQAAKWTLIEQFAPDL